ncbi:MAG TPA: transketolase C-terminal domain-containing protein [Acidimicrobiia bacterium]|nr:transketolase C-terminal domain-containing protein [Acidimicrobiia bacterium]
MPATDVLERIQRRLLWLAVRMVDVANRSADTEIKIGGHQASSTSMASIMTALWFCHLSGADKVAVKPHAAPLYHAIKYLCGDLDRSFLTRLRRQGGLQAYPSRTKDPDVADYSTGSVGLGAVAPLFDAAVGRYLDAHFAVGAPGRFIATCGDAELDEGNVWEAVLDPAVERLGNFLLIVDLNRQSLDRVVPDIRAGRIAAAFANAGWHVEMAKYGRRLEAAFARPDGDHLRRHLDAMSNEEYQSLFAYCGTELRERFLARADAGVARAVSDVADEEIGPLIHNLGGHDLETLVDRYRRCDAEADRPSVVLAYTIKGWGLPMAGDPLNHAALLTSKQVDMLRDSVGLDPDTEWDRFGPGSPEAELCEEVGLRLRNLSVPPRQDIAVPLSSGAVRSAGVVSTQEAFGRILVGLGRVDGLGERIVTTAPDVSVSTNLGGWINAHGVFDPEARPSFGPERLLRWNRHPRGRHIELGIAEMNLFLLLGQLGLAHEHHGEPLLPVGTVYDPFVLRGLDALLYSLYSGSRFVVVGTPSGVTLAPEGGAHQSTITPSVGLELPGLTSSEPAFAECLDWLLCEALSDLGRVDGRAHYLRLSTRPIDQRPFAQARERLGPEQLRHDVLAGAYVLRPPGSADGQPLVMLASGPVMPEALGAAAELEEEGLAVTVIDVTSLDRLYREWRGGLAAAARSAQAPARPGHLERLLGAAGAGASIVTVHDAASHTMAWVGSVLGQRVVPVGVDRFGESGTVSEVYALVGLDVGSLVNAGLLAASSGATRRPDGPSSAMVP